VFDADDENVGVLSFYIYGFTNTARVVVIN
jgi:hypothetical protein